MSNQIGVGVCGTGIGETHIVAYQKIPGVDVLAVAGPDVDCCTALARSYNVPRVAADYHELLAMPDIQAISICVPTAYHTPIAIEAFAAGKHVLCEKPLARTAAEAQRIVDAARASDRMLMVGYKTRFGTHAVALKAMIDDGRLGPIYYAKAAWLRRHGIPGFGGWYTSRAVAGGGALIDIGSHALDLALYYMGYPQPVSVVGSTYQEFGPRRTGLMAGQLARDLVLTGTFDVEDLAVGMVRFANGATLLVEASWASHIERDDTFSVQLFGRDGGARMLVPDYDIRDSVRVYTIVADQPVDITPHCAGSHADEEFDHEVRHFIECIRTNTETLAPGEQGVRLLRIVDALYESAELGRQVVCSHAIGNEWEYEGVGS